MISNQKKASFSLLSLIGALQVTAARSQIPSSLLPRPTHSKTVSHKKRSQSLIKYFVVEIIFYFLLGSTGRQESIYVISLRLQFFKFVLYFKNIHYFSILCSALMFYKYRDKACLSHLYITNCLMENLAQIYTQLQIYFSNECVCCTLAIFVMIYTPV